MVITLFCFNRSPQNKKSAYLSPKSLKLSQHDLCIGRTTLSFHLANFLIFLLHKTQSLLFFFSLINIMEDNKKQKLTDREKRDKRRAYMKKYYQKRKYQLGNGKSTRCKDKLKGVNVCLKKYYGDFIVSFD